MQDPTRWYSLEQLVRTCKTTVGMLLHAHQYQFRVSAVNSNGAMSEPSAPSSLVTIDVGEDVEFVDGKGGLGDVKWVEAERHASVALLQDEMIRESPPLPDRDDSPPPIYRQPGAGACKILWGK